VQHVLFAFNAKHDCQEGECLPSGSRNVIQEREASGKQAKFIVHTTSRQQYLLNTFTMHNPHRIAERLPAALRVLPLSPTPAEQRETRLRLVHSIREGRAQKKIQKAAVKAATAAVAALAADEDQIMGEPES
jgi:hypothetical protein